MLVKGIDTVIDNRRNAKFLNALLDTDNIMRLFSLIGFRKYLAESDETTPDGENDDGSQ